MKNPEPSATYQVPPSPPEERTGKYRLSSHQRERAEAELSLPSESRLKPPVAIRHHRILLATASDSVISAFLPIIRELDAAVVKVEDGQALKRTLTRRGPFDLVLSDSLLPGGTGLGILAGMRRSGQLPPFIIVQSVHEQLVRVVLGGGSYGVLSTRVVNDLALIELAEDLLGLHDGPASSRRSQRAG